MFRQIIIAVLIAAFVQIYAGGGEVKAKILILRKAGDKLENLKSKDRAKSGEEVRVFIQPQQAAYVYVIYTEDKEVTLLNFSKEQRRVEKNKTLVLPSNTEFFQFDNTSRIVNFLVICSSHSIAELGELFAQKNVTTPAKWQAVEKKLSSGSKMNLNEKVEKPFTMAGNVRSISADLMASVPLYSGEGTLIRKYEIEVKK